MIADVIISDIFRFTALVEISLTVGFALALISQAKMYVLLPFYFRVMGVSYILFAILGAVEIHLRLHSPFTWKTALAFTAGSLGLAASIWTYLKVKGKTRDELINEFHEKVLEVAREEQEKNG